MVVARVNVSPVMTVVLMTQFSQGKKLIDRPCIGLQCLRVVLEELLMFLCLFLTRSNQSRSINVSKRERVSGVRQLSLRQLSIQSFKKDTCTTVLPGTLQLEVARGRQ